MNNLYSFNRVAKVLLTLIAFFNIITFNLIKADQKPNIIFFLVDDLGWMDTSTYGSNIYETPNVERLAKEGMKFSNAYAAYPRCVPSRQAIFSGKYPCRFAYAKTQGNRSKHSLPLKETTFAEALKENGYQTCYIGKWHLGKKGGDPGKQGFDTIVHTGAAGAPGSYFYPFPTEKKKFVENPIKGKEGDYLNDILTNKALEFIDKNQKNKFLLVMSHYAVHTPLEAPESLVKKYKKKLKSKNIHIGGKKGKNKEKDVISDRKGESKTLQNNPTYAGMIENMDTNLGRVLDKLEKLNLNKNTIIIFTSDHGGLSTRGKDKGRVLATSNLPLRQGKGSIFEGGIRVPLIVKWSNKIKENSTSKVQVTGTDHYPTILEMTSSKLLPKQHKDGVSYIKALKGQNYQRKGMFWYKYMARPHSTGDTKALSYIEGKYKIIQWIDEDLVELFDLSKDISEQNNIAKEKPEILKDLLDKLNKIENEIGNLRNKGKNY